MPYTKRQITSILRNNILPANNGLTLSQQVCEAHLRRKLYAWEDGAILTLNAGFRDLQRNLITANALVVERAGIEGKLSTLNGGVIWRNALLPLIVRESDALYRSAMRTLENAAITAYYAGYVGKAWAFTATTVDGIRASLNLPTRAQVWSRIQRDWEARNGDSIDASLHAPFVDFQRKARGQLTTALSQQEAPTVAIRRLKPLVGYEQGRALYHFTQLLTRDAIMMAANLGALQFALEVSEQPIETVGGVGAVLLYLTAGDGKVCPICAPYAGRMWRLDTVNGLIGASLTLPIPPRHHGCRCGYAIIPLPEVLLPPDMPPGLTWSEYLAFEAIGGLFDAFNSRATLNVEQANELEYF